MQKPKIGKGKLFVYLAITLALAGYAFINATNLSPLYADGAFFWCVTLTAYTLAWSIFHIGGSLRGVFAASEQIPGKFNVNLGNVGFTSFPKLAKILLILPWVLFAGITVYSSVLFHSRAYRDQLGTPTQEIFSSDVQAVDLQQIPIVDKALARKLADKKLGERASLGSQVVLGEPTIQMQNDRLIWAVPLHHSGIFKWLTNLSGTPGYIVVSATDINDVEYVEGHRIKYQPSSYLWHDLGRYTRFTAAPFHGITDYSFELNDEGVPHWIVTTYRNLRGFSLPEADGVVIVNATTGATQRCTVETVPAWVDRVQPEDFILQQMYHQGEYVHGILNFADKDKFKPSSGTAIVYNNSRCYLFTGLTSVGSDESAIGFMMVDMVTKQPLLYQMNGATEAAAQASAEGKVQHLRYTATSPIIVNSNGIPTYFMTLKDQEGLVKQYALVSVTNYSTVGVGETMQEAFRSYQTALRQSNTGGALLPENGEKRTVTGTVERIASQFDGSTTHYFVILAEAPERIYVAEAALSAELPLTLVGDRVQLSHWASDEAASVLPVSEFDNLAYRQQ